MNILSMTEREVEAFLRHSYGKGAYHAAALYRHVFQEGRSDCVDVVEFAKSGSFAEDIASAISLPVQNVISIDRDIDAVKFVTELYDGALIESVVIIHKGRTTLCVSSQVGCHLGCRFCSTAKMGFIRNLSTEEIVGQLYSAKFTLGYEISNLVFMGMGEPLNNLSSVIQSIRVISESRGFNIPPKSISVSTAGVVDKLDELANSGLVNLKLAISLHTVDDKLRSELMPINRKFPLEQLREALLNYPIHPKGSILIEYILLPGYNMADSDALALAQFCKGMRVSLNLIPYNPPQDDDGFRAPTEEEIWRFHAACVDEGLFTIVRFSRGDSIAAACGQLIQKGRD